MKRGMTEQNTIKPKVVLIAHDAPWLLNFRAPLIRALKAAGSEVVVFAPGRHPEVRANLLSLGADYRAYALQRVGLDPRADLRTLAQLTRLLRQERPSHVLTTAVKPSIYGMLAARLAGVPNTFALITGLGYAFSGRSPRQRRLAGLIAGLYRASLRGATRVFVQNPDDRDVLLARRVVRASRLEIVNGSGVDLAHYPPRPLPAGPVTFLMIARLLREKGVGEYLEAARLLRGRASRPFRAVLIGPFDRNPGAFTPQALQAAQDAGTVEYLGELADVRSALRAAHAFVLPSYREGTPRSTLEALATGRAVITTDAPGCRETVRDGVNGLLVPVGDARALAGAMERLLDDPQRLSDMGARSLALAREKYDVHKVNAQMLRAMGLA